MAMGIMGAPAAGLGGLFSWLMSYPSFFKAISLATFESTEFEMACMSCGGPQTVMSCFVFCSVFTVNVKHLSSVVDQDRILVKENFPRIPF